MDVLQPSDSPHGAPSAQARRGRFHGRGILSGTFDDAPARQASASGVAPVVDMVENAHGSLVDDKATAGADMAVLQFAATSGTSLNLLEAAVRTDFARRWTGSFENPEHERAFRLRAWKYTMPTRRAGVVFMAMAVLIHVVVVVSGFVKHNDTHVRIGDQVPSIVCTVLGLGMLALGTSTRAWVANSWDYVGSCGMVLLASPMIVIYPLALCSGNIDRYSQCTALHAHVVPWESVLYVILASVVSPYLLRVGWIAGLVTSIILLVLTSASFAGKAEIGKLAFALFMMMVVMSWSAYRHEAAERDFWASLYRTARAQFLQHEAEARRTLAVERRAYAEAKSDAVQTVMRYVCHELRNPLHGIMGLLEGVKGELGELEAWVAQDVDTVWNAATGMAVVLNDVLDLGQLQRGQMALNPRECDVVQLIDNCVLTLQGVASVPIVCHIAASLPQMLTLDALRVGQIITNGVSNAAKLTKQGKVELVAQTRDQKLWFEVFDTGRGLSGDATHLFKAYAQDTGGTARHTRTRFERGTGLGLAISAQLVKLMGGDIGLENRTDGVRGARFWFWVPYQAAPGADSVHGSDGASASVGALTSTPPFGAQHATQSPAALPGTTNAPVNTNVGASPISPATELQMHQQQRRSHRAVTSGLPDVASLLRPTHADVRSPAASFGQSPSEFCVRVLPAGATATPKQQMYSPTQSLPRPASVASMGDVSAAQSANHPREAVVSLAVSDRGNSIPVPVQAGQSNGAFRDHRLYSAGPDGRTGSVTSFSTRSELFASRLSGNDEAHGTTSVLETHYELAVASQVSACTPEAAGGRGSREDPRRGLFPHASRHSAAGDGDAASVSPLAGTGGSPTRLSSLEASSSTTVDGASGDQGANADVASMLRPQHAAARAWVTPTAAGGAAAGLDSPKPQGGEAKVAGSGTPQASGASRQRSVAPAVSQGSVPPSGTADAHAARRARRKAKRDAAPKPFAGLRVLVCDDERVNRTVLTRYCTKAGCSVKAVEDADVVLHWLSSGASLRTADGKHFVDIKDADRRPFDVIFLDIMMQRSNGEDVCRRLRRAGIATPVVAATGNGVKEDLDRYREAGFSTVMLKPFSSSTVVDVLTTILPARCAQQPGGSHG